MSDEDVFDPFGPNDEGVSYLIGRNGKLRDTDSHVPHPGEHAADEVMDSELCTLMANLALAKSVETKRTPELLAEHMGLYNSYAQKMYGRLEVVDLTKMPTRQLQDNYKIANQADNDATRTNKAYSDMVGRSHEKAEETKKTLKEFMDKLFAEVKWRRDNRGLVDRSGLRIDFDNLESYRPGGEVK